MKKIIHCDGGAFIEPPEYKFHDGYFSVVGENGELLHFEKEIKDIYSANECEYLAIKWAVKNIKDRPLRITSDCLCAIAWANHSTPTSIKRNRPPLNLKEIELIYQKYNLADIWNAENYSPKYIPKEIKSGDKTYLTQ